MKCGLKRTESQVVGTIYRCWVGNAPVRCDWLSRPHRAHFGSRLVRNDGHAALRLLRAVLWWAGRDAAENRDVRDAPPVRVQRGDNFQGAGLAGAGSEVAFLTNESQMLGDCVEAAEPEMPGDLGERRRDPA